MFPSLTPLAQKKKNASEENFTCVNYIQCTTCKPDQSRLNIVSCQGWCSPSLGSDRNFHQRRNCHLLQVRRWRYQGQRTSSLDKRYSRKRPSCEGGWRRPRVPKEPSVTWSTYTHADVCGVHVLLSTRGSELWSTGCSRLCSQHPFPDAPATSH